MIAKPHHIWPPVFSLLRSFPNQVRHAFPGSRHAKKVVRSNFAMTENECRPRVLRANQGLGV